MAETFDVVVVGSGSGALTAAMRARDNGLSVVVLEKELKYGGTSATSAGFMWIPNHGLPGSEGDSREKALTYLNSVTPNARPERIEAFVDNGPAMIHYLVSKGVKLGPVVGYPDYFPEAPGAHPGRGVVPRAMDGKTLGNNFHTLREQTVKFKLFTRYSVEVEEGGVLGMRAPGWQKLLARILWNFWSDIPWRLSTKRDRRLTLGTALIGGMRRALDAQGVEVRLGHAIVALHRENGGRVTGVEAVHNGRRKTIAARHGVIIAAGGFEQSQEMRDKYWEFPGTPRVSASPPGGNTGVVTRAAIAIGAATELMDQAWWNPTLVMPSIAIPGAEVTDPVTYDFSRPHSLCVNHNGDRFVNEGSPYDVFGKAMIDDARKTGANIPCWIIFDANYRAKFALSMLWPTILLPDSRVPKAWWDTYFYRADSIAALAAKIEVNPDNLANSVARMNDFARTGIDTDFKRGASIYDRYPGDPNIRPNPALGPIDKPPYYAARVELGDIGTKGGLKADAYARVLDTNDQPIPGLYAVGNASGACFGNCYPGAGGTIGPATTYGFIAANHIAGAAKSADVQ